MLLPLQGGPVRSTPDILNLDEPGKKIRSVRGPALAPCSLLQMCNTGTRCCGFSSARQMK